MNWQHVFDVYYFGSVNYPEFELKLQGLWNCNGSGRRFYFGFPKDGHVKVFTYL